MKKLFAVLMTLALVLSMGTIAFAAGDGTITIKNAVSGEEYSIYKMLSFEPVAGSTDQGRYTVIDEWKEFIAEDGDGADYLKVNDETGTIEWNSDETTETNEAKATLAKLAVAYAKEHNIEATATQTAANDGTVTFSGLDLGYYAIDTSLGNICALTNTNSKETLFEKNSDGSIEKKVEENGTWGSENDANIGDTVNFQATITAGKGTVNYVMHDTMSEGLTFDITSVVVTKGDTTLTATNDYVITNSCEDGCTFEIDLTDSLEATLNEGEQIVVTYSAVLNENAVIAGEGNPNTVYLTYGNNQKTTESKTTTYTYQFQLVKTDANGTVITGAEFELYDAVTGGNEIAVVKVEGEEGVYRVAKEGETGVAIEAGYVTIQGLDSGTYYLEETKAPEGYNQLTERVEVVIDGANKNATVEDGAYVEGGVQVVNKTGSLLPETGGIGTTIFYVVGGLLMVAAVVFLATKKRMSAFA